MIISLVAAMAKNRVIGKEGKMPWYLPEDLKFFKELTSGNTIIMGRKTFDSIGKALPNRRNIVITRNKELKIPNVELAHSLTEALELVSSENEVFVIGGAQIYQEALSFADKLYLTHIEIEVAGDAFFPDFDLNTFKEIECSKIMQSEKSKLNYRFASYQKN